MLRTANIYPWGRFFGPLSEAVPYFAALSRMHPHLDVAIGTDHATYAEAFRDDVPYSATASPTRRALIAQWQRVHRLHHLW